MPFTSYRINLLLPGWRFTFLAVSCDMRQNILRNIWLSLCLFQKILCSVGRGTRQFLEHKAFEATARRQPPDIGSVSQVNRTGSDGDSQAVIQDTLTNQPSGTRSEGRMRSRRQSGGNQEDGGEVSFENPCHHGSTSLDCKERRASGDSLAHSSPPWNGERCGLLQA